MSKISKKKKPLDSLLTKKLIVIEIKQIVTGNKRKDYLILQIKPYLLNLYFEDLKKFFQSYSLTFFSFSTERTCHVCKNKFSILLKFTTKRKLYCASCGMAFLHLLSKKETFPQQILAILDFLIVHGLLFINQITQKDFCLKKSPITLKGGEKK